MSKLFSTDKVILMSILVISVMFVVYYSSSKSLIIDRMETGNAQMSGMMPPRKQPSVRETSAQNIVPVPQGISDSVQSGYVPQQVANPGDLLPQDQNSQFSALNPNTTGGMPDLLQAGYHIGLDTIGQSLRNANQQLRSDPVIPKMDVGPWNHSTIEPDLGRVPLEIGVGGR